MHLCRDYQYSAPLQTVIDTLMEAFLEDPSLMLNMPDVSGCSMVRKFERDGKIFATIRYCAHSQIPEFARHIISPDMLTWHSQSIWDRATKIYKFKIKTMHFTRHVQCAGEHRYTGNGNGESTHHIEINLKIDLPLIGELIEREIIKVLVKNMDEIYEQATKFFEEQASVDSSGGNDNASDS